MAFLGREDVIVLRSRDGVWAGNSLKLCGIDEAAELLVQGICVCAVGSLTKDGQRIRRRFPFLRP